ncbi:hypothetical protein BDY17DRAFT_301358 [Neohortaea acidophila]|uniref:Secreted protein n=1 Tax=Neohortaea acidophila TaxID=245834 RepID=A0A6A6PNG0_9PEZI|nr:uncharacterized protein BDY17DRAFT_301358 [Neohortaea acidophila]KAF2481445.1 hypothetical protein BDY17DRAFT_301358 [Neohortaea acidophila]
MRKVWWTAIVVSYGVHAAIKPCSRLRAGRGCGKTTRFVLEWTCCLVGGRRGRGAVPRINLLGAMFQNERRLWRRTKDVRLGM